MKGHIASCQHVAFAFQPGLGYVLRPGFDLPPLMFTAEELEAVALGVRLVRRTRDAKLQAAADSVLTKVLGALPDALRNASLGTKASTLMSATPAPGRR